MTFISFTEISITTDGVSSVDGIKPDNFLLDFHLSRNIVLTFSSRRIGKVEYS